MRSFVDRSGIHVMIVPPKGKASHGYVSSGRDTGMSPIDEHTRGVLATLKPKDVIGKFNKAISGYKVTKPAPR